MMHALSASLLSLFLLTPIGPGWLGVYIGVDDGHAVITEVMPDSPAQKAGLEAGDVLLGVGDQDTTTSEDFIRALQVHAAGDRVRIRLRRGEREQVVVVRLGERPESVGAGAPEPPAPPAPSASGRDRRPAPTAEVGRRAGQDPAAAKAGQGFLGVSVRETDDGIVVERVLAEGPLSGSGLAGGDKVTTIGDQRVRTLADLDRVLTRLRPGQRVTIAATGESGTKSIRVRVGRRPGADRAPLPRPEQGKAEAAEQVVGKDKDAPPIAEVAEVAESAERPVHEVEVAEVEEAKVETVEVEVARPAQGRERRRVRAPRAESGNAQQRPERGARPDRPERSEPPRATPQYDLQRELTELRQELAELRRMLEELRKKKGGE